jgi:3-oxoadipate enol-lactonase
VNLLEAGAPTDPAVLLIHGYPFHAGMWREQLAAPPPGWRLIAPDLPGFGATPPPAALLGIDSLADELAGLIGRLHLGSVVLCGLSMGGYIALALLRRHAALVRGLVLSDTRAGADSDDGRRKRHELAARIRAEGSGAVVDAMLPRLLSAHSVEHRPALRAEVEAMMRGTAPDTLVAGLLAMAERADSEPLLQSVAVPTEVIVGADDEITPLHDAQVMARGVPGAHLTVIPDAGHIPPLEQPQRFNAALHAFLARLERSAAD